MDGFGIGISIQQCVHDTVEFHGHLQNDRDVYCFRLRRNTGRDNAAEYRGLLNAKGRLPRMADVLLLYLKLADRGDPFLKQFDIDR